MLKRLQMAGQVCQMCPFSACGAYIGDTRGRCLGKQHDAGVDAKTWRLVSDDARGDSPP